MRPVRVLTIFFLCYVCSSLPAQEVFLQLEGKFLYPPNLSTGGDNVLLGNRQRSGFSDYRNGRRGKHSN
jgi:hypothetical protein